MGMMGEFREFIAKGNVLDLAVGVIIGAAFGKIVTSLTEDVLMPIIGAIFGGVDFSSQFIRLGPLPAGFTGDATNYAALKAAGVPMIGYGALITELINFLILAFIIFQIVKFANRVMRRGPDAPAGPTEAELLAEIRDELRRRP